MITPARLTNGTIVDYGYGLGLGSIESNFATSHAGSIPGFHTYLIHIPGDEITVAVLVNAVSATRSWAREIARALAEAMVDRNIAGAGQAVPSADGPTKNDF